MQVYVQTTTYCDDSWRDEGEFASWGASYTFSVNGVSLTQTGYDEQFDIDVELKAGDVVHVLWMTYSTGDSFGRSTGNGEVLWVFKDATLGSIALTQWREACTEDYPWSSKPNKIRREKQYSVTFKVDGDRSVQLSNPAYGYFETLEQLQLTTMLVQI